MSEDCCFEICCFCCVECCITCSEEIVNAGNNSPASTARPILNQPISNQHQRILTPKSHITEYLDERFPLTANREWKYCPTSGPAVQESGGSCQHQPTLKSEDKEIQVDPPSYEEATCIEKNEQKK